MTRKFSEEPVQGPLADALMFYQVRINLNNAYLRLAVRKRRKVMHALEHFAFGKSKTASYWDVWSKDDAERCYRELRPISKKMANDFRRWAAMVLKVGANIKLGLKFLMEELIVRTWIDEP